MSPRKDYIFSLDRLEKQKELFKKGKKTESLKEIDPMKRNIEMAKDENLKFKVLSYSNVNFNSNEKNQLLGKESYNPEIKYQNQESSELSISDIVPVNVKPDFYQPVVKHLYKIIKRDKVKCKKCDMILKNTNIDYSRLVKSESELTKIYNNKKKFGIIGLIYRVSIKKDVRNNYLHFPGKFYIGLTTSTLEQEWIDHLSGAFNEQSQERRRNDKFSRALRKYSNNNRELARNLFKIEIWQVCFNQEELDEAEKFWIGFFKTQQDKFGFNTLEGGRINPPQPREEKSPFWIDIPFKTFDNALRECLNINPIEGPVTQLAERFAVHEATINSKIAFFYKDENGKRKTYLDLRREYIKLHLEFLMKKGWKSTYVGKILGKKFNISKSNRPNIANEWCKLIYKKTYTKVQNELLKEEFERIAFNSLMKGKNITYDDFAIEIPGLTIWGIHIKMYSYFSGLKELMKKIRRPIAIALALENLNGQKICQILGYSKKNTPAQNLFRKLFWDLSLGEFRNLVKGIMIECMHCKNKQTYTIRDVNNPPKIPQARCVKCGKSIYPKL